MDQKQIEARLMEMVNGRHQFSAENGILLERVEEGYAEGRLTTGENSINPGGNIHGGALATLADVVGGCCACSKGGVCVTASSNLEYLRPAAGPWIKGVARARKLGRALSVIQVDLTDNEDRLVACGTFTFYMFPNENGR
ncbi:MAG: PaaI family thioesterase [Clostridium sp.]|nr:PaaI family thioesterase [Clostridium sp.]